MQQILSGGQLRKFITPLIILATAIISLTFFSFTANTFKEDFLLQLGISKTDADKKITTSMLGGYLDAWGVKNLKNIATGNRSAIAQDLLNYTKQYVNSEGFKKEYAALKADHKPVQNKIESPEDMRNNMIQLYKKSVAELEITIQKADANTKKIFENVLTDAKKQLKEAEDPNNKSIANYAKNYDQMVKMNLQGYEQTLKDWEMQYPSNQLLFVKERLVRFLEETKNIDFSAALVQKNGKQIFADPQYERKTNYWKMAFRAGKEVVEPSRNFVQQWLQEIK